MFRMSAGILTSELRYTPWGETRYTWTKDMTPGLPGRYTFTSQYSHMDDYTFTGQRSYMDDPTTAGREGFGLMFYNARWYDVGLGRFAQADSIVPGGVQGLDRYAAMFNNPIKYNDPSGHTPACGFSYSDPECEKPEIKPPSEKMAAEVLYNLAGGDETIYAIWLTLYQTQAGHELAMYIYEHEVRMEFWGETTSKTGCASSGCTIYLSIDYMPSTTPIDINRAAAELGHEAYHASVWRLAPDGVPVEGGWWQNLQRELGWADAELRNSQWEEAMAFYVEDEIYFELTGLSGPPYEDLFVTNVASLQTWIKTYHDPYKRYPPYPEYDWKE